MTQKGRESKKKRTGNVLLLLTLSSPLWCLTSVFGMGTGVSTTPSSPDSSFFWKINLSKLDTWLHVLFFLLSFFDKIISKVLDLLVLLSWMCHHTYTCNLSTSSSSRGLTHRMRGKSNLGVGFTLRCFQRLSVPYVATQLCHWRDNWCTRGADRINAESI